MRFYLFSSAPAIFRWRCVRHLIGRVRAFYMCSSAAPTEINELIKLYMRIRRSSVYAIRFTVNVLASSCTPRPLYKNACRYNGMYSCSWTKYPAIKVTPYTYGASRSGFYYASLEQKRLNIFYECVALKSNDDVRWRWRWSKCRGSLLWGVGRKWGRRGGGRREEAEKGGWEKPRCISGATESHTRWAYTARSSIPWVEFFASLNRPRNSLYLCSP